MPRWRQSSSAFGTSPSVLVVAVRNSTHLAPPLARPWSVTTRPRLLGSGKTPAHSDAVPAVIRRAAELEGRLCAYKDVEVALAHIRAIAIDSAQPPRRPPRHSYRPAPDRICSYRAKGCKVGSLIEILASDADQGSRHTVPNPIRQPTRDMRSLPVGHYGAWCSAGPKPAARPTPPGVDDGHELSISTVRCSQSMFAGVPVSVLATSSTQIRTVFAPSMNGGLSVLSAMFSAERRGTVCMS